MSRFAREEKKSRDILYMSLGDTLYTLVSHMHTYTSAYIHTRNDRFFRKPNNDWFREDERKKKRCNSCRGRHHPAALIRIFKFLSINIVDGIKRSSLFFSYVIKSMRLKSSFDLSRIKLLCFLSHSTESQIHSRGAVSACARAIASQISLRIRPTEYRRFLSL